MRHSLIGAAATTLLLAVDPALADAPKEAWGKQVGGIQVAISIRPSRDEFHPGEFLRFHALVSHVGPDPLHVPWNDSGGQWVTVHVTTPDGQEFICDPLRRDVNTGLFKNEKHWRPSAKGNWWSAQGMQWRLADLSGWSWIDGKTKQNASISLRRPGVYRVWADYEVVAAPDSPPDAWQGKASSQIVEWIVSELPVEKRAIELTAQQEEDLRIWLKNERNNQTSRAWNRIHESLLWAENEALAIRLASIATNNSDRSLAALSLLGYRAGQDSELGIDGPYLKEAANVVMSLAEDKLVVEEAPVIEHLGWQLLLVYLKLHPDDNQTAGRAVAVAKAHCKLEKGGVYRPPVHENRLAAMPLEVAWDVLLTTGVLHAGMTLEEATEILGEALRVDSGLASWTLASMSRAITSIAATVRDGKVAVWHARR